MIYSLIALAPHAWTWTADNAFSIWSPPYLRPPEWAIDVSKSAYRANEWKASPQNRNTLEEDRIVSPTWEWWISENKWFSDNELKKWVSKVCKQGDLSLYIEATIVERRAIRRPFHTKRAIFVRYASESHSLLNYFPLLWSRPSYQVSQHRVHKGTCFST